MRQQNPWQTNDPMAEESKIFQLIARQGSAANPGLDSLLRALINDHGLDAYSARTRLTGSGKALLCSGNREAMERLAALLRDHGYDCWVIQRTDQTVASAASARTGCQARRGRPGLP